MGSSSSPLSAPLTIVGGHVFRLVAADVGDGERSQLPSISVMKNEVQQRRLAFSAVDIAAGRIIVGGMNKKLVVEAIRLSVIGRDKKCNWKN
jgi:hypothetical protein